MSEAEVIAMVLPEDSGDDRDGRATLLVREPDGRVSLESVKRESPLGHDAQRAGCFRRRAPIIDPVTRKIVGYELEMVPSPLV